MTHALHDCRMGKLCASLLGSLVIALAVTGPPVAAQETGSSRDAAEWQTDDAHTGEILPQTESDHPEQLAAAIAGLVRDADSPVGESVAAFYDARDYRTAWLDAAGQRAARMLLSRAASAHEDGVCPLAHEDGRCGLAYDADRLARELAMPRAGTEAAAAFDVAITEALARFIVHMGLGRDAARDRGASTRTLDVAASLDEARQAGTSDSLDRLAPRHPEYVALREALAVYHQIDAAGGFPQLPDDLFLRPGASMAEGDHVALQSRLRMTGDLDDALDIEVDREATGSSENLDAADNGDAVPAASPDHAEYGEALVEAVRRFQARHGLQVDGVIGPQTVSALNVPVTQRIEQIAINLDRWRRLPDDLGRRHVRVNIPDYTLAVVEDGRTQLTMRTIVGQTDRQTPVFSDRIRYLEFRPSWNVPDSIVERDILPRVQEDPEYLEANRYEVLEDWGGPPADVDLEAFDWEAETFTWRLRQRPGPHNSLGLVKFMFPNRYAVYLHDTPAPGLFERRVRTFSSGCVRVEDPVGLATALLGEEEEPWTSDRVRAAMNAGRTSIARLSEPVPVHLSYFTAWVDDSGLVMFRPDVYGRDARAAERPSSDTEEQ